LSNYIENPSPFRVAANNVRLMRSLFFETAGPDKQYVVYTLKDHDHVGYPSLYRLYMETNDPTEWEFAQKYVDGWDHWERLCESPFFQPYVQRWRKELELRMKSKALARIMAESKTSGKESFAANKYLLEKGWEPKDGQNKRGRPSKQEIAQAAKEQAQHLTRLDDDFERITLQRTN